MNPPVRKDVAGILAILIFAVSITILATSCGRGDKVREAAPGGELWLEEMRVRIKKHITNEDAAVRLLAEVDRLEEEVLAFDAATIAYLRSTQGTRQEL